MSPLTGSESPALQVRPFDTRSLDQAPRGVYDILMATLGYEGRARAIAEALGGVGRQSACGFERNRDHSYELNRDWFAGHGFDVVEPPDAGYRTWLCEWLRGALRDAAIPPERPTHLAIDVSSMTRDRIAIALEVCLQLGQEHVLDVDFLYAPAEYHDPPQEPDFTASIEPMTPFFRGWTPDPLRAAVALVGLGYEIDKAVGAKEYLELKDLWAYIADGGDVRYAEKVRQNNELLWLEVQEERIVRYPLTDPYGVFVQLESQLFGVLRSGRALMLPMGPKIFALCSMLAALHHHPEVGVWRVRQREMPVDRQPDGQLLGLSARFGTTTVAHDERAELSGKPASAS